MDNNYLLLASNDETCYFSALEEIQNDQTIHQQQEEEVDSLDSENYYSQLRRESMASRHVYMRIQTVDFSIPEDFFNDRNQVSSIVMNMLESSKSSNKSSSRNRSKKTSSEIYEESISDSEPEFSSTRVSSSSIRSNSPRQSDSNVEVLLDITDNLLDGFEKKMKNTRSRFVNMDQTMEESLEENQYEEFVDSVIQSMAAEMSRQNFSSKSKSRSDTRDSLTKTERSLLEYSFKLSSNINLTPSMAKVGEFNRKISSIMDAGNMIVKFVAGVFKCLINFDFNGLVRNFVSLPVKDRWNVLKNLIYYTARIAMLDRTQRFLGESAFNSSLVNILNLIVSYIRNFEQIRLC